MTEGTKGNRRRILDRLSAAQIMTSPVALVRASARIQEAAVIMCQRRISAVVVIDDHGGAIGLLSASNIVRHAPKAMETLADERVDRIMTKGLLTVPPTETVDAIARKMVENEMRRIIVEDKGSVVGVVSSMDLARCLWKTQSGEKVTADRRPRRLRPLKR